MGLDGGERRASGRVLAAAEHGGGVPSRRRSLPERLDGGRRAQPSSINHPEWGSLPFLGCDGLPDGGRRMVARATFVATVLVSSNTGPALELVSRWLRSGEVPPREVLLPRARTRRKDRIRPWRRS